MTPHIAPSCTGARFHPMIALEAKRSVVHRMARCCSDVGRIFPGPLRGVIAKNPVIIMPMLDLLECSFGPFLRSGDLYEW